MFTKELDFTSQPKFQDKVEGKQNVYFYPFNTSALDKADQIRIAINDSNGIYSIHESFLSLVGKVNKKSTAGTGTFDLINGGFLALFDSITFYLNGHEVDTARLPYLTTWLKSLLSFSKERFDDLEHCGFQNPNDYDVMPHSPFQRWFQATDKEASVSFNVVIPLKLVMGVFEDHTTPFVNQTMELVLQRSISDVNIFKGSDDAKKSDITLEKITWVVPALKLSDRERAKYFDMIARDPSMSRYLNCFFAEQETVTKREEKEMQATSTDVMGRSILGGEIEKKRGESSSLHSTPLPISPPSLVNPVPSEFKQSWNREAYAALLQYNVGRYNNWLEGRNSQKELLMVHSFQEFLETFGLEVPNHLKAKGEEENEDDIEWGRQQYRPSVIVSPPQKEEEEEEEQALREGGEREQDLPPSSPDVIFGSHEDIFSSLKDNLKRKRQEEEDEEIDVVDLLTPPGFTDNLFSQIEKIEEEYYGAKHPLIYDNSDEGDTQIT
ncbi:hypothetical protein GE061_012289 [Apolygus lucorum]|uniref:Double jelly roll-like domain-containing protein n=1 Tax=Apolygus lucorum TaxID=248454 RepID=A0A8S9XT33_APOLU|nr:hypothetical protein GE061_012289 [Apolygus lucorum]